MVAARRAIAACDVAFAVDDRQLARTTGAHSLRAGDCADLVTGNGDRLSTRACSIHRPNIGVDEKLSAFLHAIDRADQSRTRRAV